LGPVFDVNYECPKRHSTPEAKTRSVIPFSIREEEKSNNTMSKVWFTTGSSRGIGRKVAEAALLAGEQVVATARKLERCMNWWTGTGTASVRCNTT
jgi:hypothetical protein